jgi:MoaA/NifB/PqqE/SkfB family radical SAM enzyme
MTKEKNTATRQRTEPNGLVTSYNPIARTMSILNPDHSDFQGEFNQELIGNPTRVVLEIESYCSSGCRYCSEGKDTQCRRNIPKERLFEIIDEAEDMGVHELTIRGGEATEHPYFEQVWNYAASKKFLTPNVITNGMQFDKERVQRLLENSSGKVIVSLDGFKDTNSIHRNPQQYDLVMSWMPEAIRDFPEQLVVLSCLYRQNLGEVPRFARFLAEQGLGHYHLPPLKRLGRAEMADENFVSLKEMDALQESLDNLAEEFPGFKPVISCGALEKFKQNKTKEIPVPLFNEMHYGTGMKITPEGNAMVNRGIMFTDRFKNGINTTISLEPLGSIYEDTLKNIWKNSQDLRIEQGKLADKHYAYYLGWLKTLE